MGAISEGFRESPHKGVAKVSGRTRSSREHDRSLWARPGPLSRFSGDREYPVSLGHSSDDRSLHSEHHSARRTNDRSEEHTSELQSPCNLVCRLLLEKKKDTEPQAHP